MFNSNNDMQADIKALILAMSKIKNFCVINPSFQDLEMNYLPIKKATCSLFVHDERQRLSGSIMARNTRLNLLKGVDVIDNPEKYDNLVELSDQLLSILTEVLSQICAWKALMPEKNTVCEKHFEQLSDAFHNLFDPLFNELNVSGRLGYKPIYRPKSRAYYANCFTFTENPADFCVALSVNDLEKLVEESSNAT